MKVIFRTPLLIIFLFISLTTINAATVTWLGGNSAWDNAAQWDTGTVPSYGDDVIIPSGYCKIYNGDSEGATSVEVQSSARLYIYNGGSLEISGAVDNHGLHNMGRVYHYGKLAINSITQTSPAASANAIKNESRIYTYSSSQINIKYIDDVAIYNDAAYSYFRARGSIWIYSVSNAAIFNFDRFYNSGTIDISDCGVSSGFLMANTDDFRNLSGGVMTLNSNIYGGLSNASVGANFRNYGEINIDEVSIGVNNHGSLTNYSGATIDSENNYSTSYNNRLSATITNYGYLKSTLAGSGIYNYGNLINHESFTVFQSNANGCIRNFSTGHIDNYDYLYLSGTTSIDISNEGTMTNHYGGHIALNKTVETFAGSDISNYGFFVTYGSGSHSIGGTFGNKGVIDDNHGQLQGAILNDRLVIAPVSGPMQVGVPYPNVLDVASLDDVDLVDWKISQNGAVAGTYNEATNEFTPNASAVGITTIYIEVYDLVSGAGRNFSLEIGSPILPFTKTGKTASTRNGQDNEFADMHVAEVNIYPNPTSGNIQLESPVFENNQTQVHLYNNLGQLVQQERLNSGSMNQSIDFSSQLTNGIYFVKILQEDKEINIRRIQLHR